MLTTSQISSKIDLSVIVAVYNEDPRNLMSVVERLDAIIKPTAVHYELIFVNDGSRPPTTNALRQIAAEFEHVKLVSCLVILDSRQLLLVVWTIVKVLP
jgi:glycosyltransferase involved in cell wall biosynthesis